MSALALVLFLSVASFAAPADLVVLPDVTVIDGTEKPPVAHATIVIRGSKIEAVRRSPVPSNELAGARVLHYEGKFVIPGIVNGHGHLGVTDGVNTRPSNYNPANIERQLKQYLSYGVTTMMSLGLNSDLIYQLREEQQQGRFDGAIIWTAGRGIGIPGGVPAMDVGADQLYRPATPEQARQAVDETAQHHPDVIKMWVDDNLGKLPRPKPGVEAAVIEEAHRRGLLVAAHIFYLDDAKILLRDGVDILAHSIRDQPVDNELIELMRQRNAFYIPTLQLEEAFFAYADQPQWMRSRFFENGLQPDVRQMLFSPEYIQKTLQDPATAKHRKFLATAQQNLKTLSDAGIHIGFGTDSGAMPTRIQGFAEHRELQLMVASGMTPAQALHSATEVAAEMYRKADQTGSIQPGRSADLVVLDGDPLAHIEATEKIVAILHNGVESRPVTAGSQ